MKTLIVLAILLVPFCAFGEEMVFYATCELRDGKTTDDLSAGLNEWKALKDKNGLDFSLRVLTPHTAADTRLNVFVLEGSSSTFVSYAKGFEWWYTNNDAQSMSLKLDEIYTCTSSSLYRVNSVFK